MLSAVLEAARLLIPAATRLSGYSASWLSRRTFEKQLCLRFLQKASEFKVELTPFFELDTERSTGSGKDSLSATRLFVEWLESPHNFLLLLGGPGSGKTTFCKRAFELIRNRSDVERFRHFEACTFYVQCRDIHGKTYAAIDSQMYRAFASFYFHEVGETEKYVSLLRRIKRRPCLFILDGLDEFPSQDREQLCELVSRINALGVDHKVLVTCRDNMFLDDTELVETVSTVKFGQRKPSYIIGRLLPLREELFTAYLKERHPVHWKTYQDTLINVKGLSDLGRPILFRMTLDILEQVENLGQSYHVQLGNVASVYWEYIKIWLIRECQKHFDLEYADYASRLALMERLAWCMSAENRTSVSSQQLEKRFPDVKQLAIVRLGALLQRERGTSERFSFLHVTLQQYLVARSVMKHVAQRASGGAAAQGDVTLDDLFLDETILLFSYNIEHAVDPHCERILSICEELDSHISLNVPSNLLLVLFYILANAIRDKVCKEAAERIVRYYGNVLGRLLAITPKTGTFRTIVLRNVSGTEIKEVKLRDVDLSRARLVGAIFDHVSLDAVQLGSSVFDGACINCMVAIRSALDSVLFSAGSVTNSIFTAVTMSHAILRRSRLYKVRFENVTFVGAVFEHLIIDECLFVDVDFAGARMSFTEWDLTSLRNTDGVSNVALAAWEVEALTSSFRDQLRLVLDKEYAYYVRHKKMKEAAICQNLLLDIQGS